MGKQDWWREARDTPQSEHHPAGECERGKPESSGTECSRRCVVVWPVTSHVERAPTVLASRCFPGRSCSLHAASTLLDVRFRRSRALFDVFWHKLALCDPPVSIVCRSSRLSTCLSARSGRYPVSPAPLSRSFCPPLSALHLNLFSKVGVALAGFSSSPLSAQTDAPTTSSSISFFEL